MMVMIVTVVMMVIMVMIVTMVMMIMIIMMVFKVIKLTGLLRLCRSCFIPDSRAKVPLVIVVFLSASTSLTGAFPRLEEWERSDLWP